MTPATSRLRVAAERAALVAGSIVVTLAVIEGVLRLTGAGADPGVVKRIANTKGLDVKPGTTTLPPVIVAMNGQTNIDYSVIAASGFLGALPAVLLVLIFQKQMVQGLTAGSVKG